MKVILSPLAVEKRPTGNLRVMACLGSAFSGRLRVRLLPVPFSAGVTARVTGSTVPVKLRYPSKSSAEAGSTLIDFAVPASSPASMRSSRTENTLLNTTLRAPFWRLSSFGVPTSGAQDVFVCVPSLNVRAFSDSTFTVPATSVAG